MDYWREGHAEDIRTFSSLAGEDVIPLPYLFRDFDQMPAVEQRALELARGKVLDIGCGAGSHALYLQEKDWRSPAWTVPRDASGSVDSGGCALP